MVSGGWYYSRFHLSKRALTKTIDASSDSVNKNSLSSHISALQKRTLSKNYNNEVAFFIDMSIESGKKRFFIVNLKTNTLIDAGLVTHGRCNKNWLNGRQYSNTIGGGCTSLGLYKIGGHYNGRFGLAYKLHGLDSSNSNAFKRYVVLHSMECVPENETHPLPICQSDGCPTVSPGFLKKLQPLLDKSAKPMLLYIYE